MVVHYYCHTVVVTFYKVTDTQVLPDGYIQRSPQPEEARTRVSGASPPQVRYRNVYPRLVGVPLRMAARMVRLGIPRSLTASPR